ncbi:MAG: type II toxin-antitoxin system Phd/YefM family antitoxin [gamma proteobacterium symbiont of Lucinoma myriamae]|nr:type II toxin-antitoxin system Phd/YefM family antitoxin [gamma proteobacterium symbiont of Lucinoma myriamae]MCU7819230.1 type II toxin-antitoxin system Phd/YefM family antitoxin [gamma proteobacterium symbiont of Lucinoma myriamae]MCU7832852.1 type II toxin-antitoxin system Phd/YefM family antitoxin [gamma proteobacterium symbiont of Lucinoma myriamae]
MLKLNSHEAKLNFSKIMIQIANGKEIIITRAGQDFAKITPLKKSLSHKRRDEIKAK